MAKLKMQKLRITALSKERKPLLDRFQRLGLVEFRNVEHDEVIVPPDTDASRERLSQAVRTIESALEALDSYSTEKKPFLSGFRSRPEISSEEFEDIPKNSDTTLSLCSRILKEHKQFDELQAEIIRKRAKLDTLNPWLGLDIPMRFEGTEHTSVIIGTVQMQISEGDLLSKIAEQEPEIECLDIEKVGSSGEMSCFAITCLRKEKPQVENALRVLGFARPAELSEKTPAQAAADLQTEIAECEEKKQSIAETLAKHGEKRKELQYLLDHCTMRLEKYEAMQGMGVTEHSFIIEGWCALENYEKVEQEAAKFGAYCEKIEPKKREAEPVLLRNNGFFEGGEPILGMYSLPSKNDIDPTAVMAFFYYMLFGLMLGDAAYGLIMVVATLFVLIKLKPEGSQRKNMKLFCFSGISAVIWGVLFGSVFGDLPNVIAKNFFGATDNIIKPILFDPIAEPMTMMIFSIAIGGIHIFVGLLMGAIAAFKNKDIAAAFFDYLSWLVMLISGIGWALVTLLGESLPFALPPIVSPILLGLTLFCAVVILFMNGRSSRNFLIRIMKGAYALYGITSYLSDFVSYSRLLALALATGVISQVFNQMAVMVGSSGGVGIVLLIIVCIIGHAFNIGISLIGCYVHTSRLQYVEFFGKFYEGGGEAFAPLSANTKHFKFKEEK